MFIQSDSIALSSSCELDLCTWANAVYEKAVGDGLIHVPWEPDDAIVRRLEAYFHTGLSPAEAVSALPDRSRTSSVSARSKISRGNSVRPQASFSRRVPASWPARK